jgi:hypothetical protein
VHKWPEEEKQYLIKDINEGGMKNKVYRIPRGFSANLDQDIHLTNSQEPNKPELLKKE